MRAVERGMRIERKTVTQNEGGRPEREVGAQRLREEIGRKELKGGLRKESSGRT